MSAPERFRAEEKELHLKNGAGRKLTVTLRQSRPGDEEGMIACIQDEYGDTYFKKELYERTYIRKEAESGHITFLIAETKAGEIAGMLTLREHTPEENICELASVVFRKKYRGYGLAMPFCRYGMRILRSCDYAAAYCLPVLFHDITQKVLYRFGMCATGFILNVFDLERIIHSYFNGKNTKHSMGVQVQAVGKTDAGRLYIPHEYQTFCSRIYMNLHVNFRLMPEGGKEDMPEQMPMESGLSYRQDETQSSMEICVCRVGADLYKRMEELHGKYPLRGRQTENVFLNINDPYAVSVCQRLRETGYFFTGLKPLCGENEYMILHHPGEVECFMEDYAVSPEFSKILKYVKRNYERREKEDERK